MKKMDTRSDSGMGVEEGKVLEVVSENRSGCFGGGREGEEADEGEMEEQDIEDSEEDEDEVDEENEDEDEEEEMMEHEEDEDDNDGVDMSSWDEIVRVTTLQNLVRMIYGHGNSILGRMDATINEGGDDGGGSGWGVGGRFVSEPADLTEQLAAKIVGSDLDASLRHACGGPSPAGTQSPATETGLGRGKRFSQCSSHTLTGREVRARPAGLSEKEKRELLWRRIPCGRPSLVAKFGCRVYGGRFSQDGSTYICSTQGKQIVVFDTQCGSDGSFVPSKVIGARHIRWTITDTDLSPDGRFVIYSTTTSAASLANTVGEYELHESMELGASHQFGIFCLRFGAGGQEIVAGCNDHVLRVYDVEHKRILSETVAHDDDINAVAFGDDSYRSDVIYSGSDDSLIKVWDRRILGNGQQKPQGVLVGHTEGITHINSKGDGRYLISNGKDQCTKLWDIRRMICPDTLSEVHPIRRRYNWDYRMMGYPGMGRHHMHPHDQSLMTYRGHLVLETLIRCYFSPIHTTGQRYVYTGSADGKVMVYDSLTGKPVASMSHREMAVRDVAWHPYDPLLCTVSWDGMVTKWEYDPDQSESDGRAVNQFRDLTGSDGLWEDFV